MFNINIILNYYLKNMITYKVIDFGQCFFQGSLLINFYFLIHSDNSIGEELLIYVPCMKLCMFIILCVSEPC